MTRPGPASRTMEWSSEHLPAAERLPAWRTFASSAWAPVHVSTAAPGPFRGQVRARRVGALALSVIDSEAQAVRRGPAEIAAGAGDSFFVNLPLATGASVRQAGHEARLTPGDFVIVDGRRPFELDFAHAFRQVSVAVPAELIARRLDDDPPVAMRVSGDAGAGAVAGGALRALARDRSPLDRHSARTLGEQVASLICLALTQARPPRPVSPRATLLAAAREEIRGSLADPALSPAMLARRLSISLRLLHALFGEQGTSVSRWILEQRLLAAWTRLREEGPDGSPIAAIAHDLGFTDPSHFARTFRTRFGVTPTEARRTDPARPSG